MKKKNLLIYVTSLVLVAALSIGGTIAYLTDTDDAVVNTFQFANGIQVTIEEQYYTPTQKNNETITPNSQKGFDYTNLVPGQEIDKAPKLGVTTSVDAYVFAKIIPNANLTIGAITEGWTELQDNVYYKTVDGQEGTQDLGTLFTEVTVNPVDLDSNASSGYVTDLGAIEIQVAAIQVEGLTPAQAYAAATFHTYTAA